MKEILITGASRGIGFETTKLLLEEGYNIKATSTSGQINIEHENLTKIQLNLLDKNSIQQTANSINKIDVLINNAGILLEKRDNPNINMDQLRETFEVNVFGLIDFCEKCIPKIKPGGTIIIVGSQLGSFSRPETQFQQNYKMSKAAIHMYSRVLAERLRQKNVSVYLLDPGWVKTDMGGINAPRTAQEAAKDVFNLVTKKRETGKFWFEGKEREW